MASETSTGTPRSSGPAGGPGVGGDLAAVVLAAGLGTRLRPLTRERPKPLCPVGNISLVDGVIDRCSAVTDRIAVNVHAGRRQMERHFAAAGAGAPVQLADAPGQGGSRRDVAVQLSFEEPEVLGTAGALGQLRWWIDGRPVLVVNGDSWSTADLGPFVRGWDGERVAVLLHDPAAAASGLPVEFSPRSRLVATIVPWREVSKLANRPSGLYRGCLEPAAAARRLSAVAHAAPFFDCGTPASYLAANLAVAGTSSVIAPGASVGGHVERSVVGDAVIDGAVSRCVLWSGASVAAGERLVDAIRTGTGMTVLVR